MEPSPFDDELADAYAALTEEAAVPKANRRALIRKLLPAVGLGTVAVVLVGMIGAHAWQARSNAAQLTPVHAAQSPTATPPPGTSPNHPNQEATPATPGHQSGPASQSGQGGQGVALGVQDLAVRYAYTWANRGGGLDTATRLKELAAMRGDDAPPTTPPQDEGMQVVLDAHIAEISTRESTQVVTVALLLAGSQAPMWSALQIAIVPSTTGGWTVAGDPAWVAFPPTGKPAASTTAQLTWVTPEQSTSREQLTTFFTKYGQDALIHDPSVVGKPLQGLNGLMRFDQLEGVATDGDSSRLYARVRWVNQAGVVMSQVYRLHIASTGGIDSVEVAAIH